MIYVVNCLHCQKQGAGSTVCWKPRLSSVLQQIQFIKLEEAVYVLQNMFATYVTVSVVEN